MSYSPQDPRRPLADTAEEASRWLDAELRAWVPEGWTLEPMHAEAIAWMLERVAIPEGEWPHQNFHIRLTGDLDLVIVTCGNVDAGEIHIGNVVREARLIGAHAIRAYGLAACLDHVMATCKPNEWAYT